ncbi:V-type ATP synthase subunit A [Methylomarinum sp. Ch1-1]|uniref:V-type ATP synthase alpha chain n=1 Tax=Methylomarinum roseum TaxID=3067653 RepID=A0AAU7NQM9_9GAMM|nr:V-type ATP synthase subunit A [Methylomarinum sp. Ch1-1]MDP4520778.1 V-type ATP synthase subunit A [Methylomarinum sp. Ch1-1]
MNTETQASAKVIAVQDDIVSIQSLPGVDKALTKNELVYILPSRSTARYTERLKAEVLRIHGDRADAQVYESTAGIAVGDPVEQSGRMLSVELGPGLLGQVYDGLQNPLDLLGKEYGYFLPRGVDLPALDVNSKWAFTPIVQSGEKVTAGSVIGTVVERRFTHKIMVPFDVGGEAEVIWIQEGAVSIEEAVAVIRLKNGREQNIYLKQSWPVRIPLPRQLLMHNLAERQYPDRPLITHLRLIDTFFPIAEGGTGCIPGPFGAGKTVLQNLISRNSDVDIVIVVACGERAGEVVETITEFPQLSDPKGSGSLMDRTIIICNTSSMPVAAREASIYTGITLGEYYRQMGLNVLLLADSTSRWAQAMRETSARLEEIPGEEAFPAYLDSSIKSIYERAGMLVTADGSRGSLTMIGTVSPAGGNFEEPVTQSTLNTVKTFLGLSAERAYKRFYPAVDPLISWSRYLEQLHDWYERELEPGWSGQVLAVLALLKRGDDIYQMIQVAGEEGITLADYVTYQEALFVDMVYLQQDAFDEVDVAVPIQRQKENFKLLVKLVTADYRFGDQSQAREYFVRLTGLFKNLNYAKYQSAEYQALLNKIDELAGAVQA